VGANGTHSCSSNPSWFPLNQSEVEAFDEEEHPTDLCFQGDNVSPPTGGSQTCFPLETQRVSLLGGNLIGSDPTPPTAFGWVYLNLNHTLVSGDPYPGRAQAWIMTLVSGSFSATKGKGHPKIGHRSVLMDNAVSTPPLGVMLCSPTPSPTRPPCPGS
jgi:hypothetical protein